jgi:hypothetical protein
MASPISKLVPTAVVVAAVSYCAWPYVFPSSAETGGKQTAAMPEIAAAQLSPAILPLPTRDPFRPAGEKKTAPVPTVGPTGRAAARSDSATRSKGNAPADPLGGLTLCATSILGGQRLAVINGRIYAEREQLKTKDLSAPPCRVARILHDRVLLECEGRTATLGYANAAAQPKANKTGGVAQPVGPDAPPATSRPAAGSHHPGLRNHPPS